MNCEYCNNEHDGKYGSGRFCDRVCARGFSTKAKRKEINKKIEQTFKIRRDSKTKEEVLNKQYARWRIAKIKQEQNKRYYEKYFKRCAVCGYDVVVDIHHLKTLYDEEWLVSLCPNHHKECHIKKSKYSKEQFIELRDLLIRTQCSLV